MTTKNQAAENLKFMRQSIGLTVEQLAEKTGLTTEVINDLENYPEKIQVLTDSEIKNFVTVCDYFCVSLDNLFTGRAEIEVKETAPISEPNFGEFITSFNGIKKDQLIAEINGAGKVDRPYYRIELLTDRKKWAGGGGEFDVISSYYRLLQEDEILFRIRAGITGDGFLPDNFDVRGNSLIRWLTVK